ncbi:MAG: site-2 protease family protein [Clostridia bacterium]|nr:site-2 protease family protein [Clostridia bacterium]
MLTILTDKSGIVSYGFLFALVHEIGHILAMMLFKVKIEKIKFGFINIDLVSSGSDKIIKDKINIIILLSGFFANMLFFWFFYICFFYIGEKMYYFWSMQNLFIGILNLLPIDSLDGGKILRIILNKYFDFFLVEKILKYTSFIILIPLFLIGVCVLFYSWCNFSLVILAIYLIIFLFKGVVL